MDLLRELATIKDLATLPVVVFRVLELLEDPDVSIDVVGKAIESDMSITLKILRITNSPLYGFRTEVTSMRDAVTRLGLNRIANTVMSVALFTKFFNVSSRQNSYMTEFWRHSVATATVAKTLAERLKLRYNDREFVAGLLHDIGKMAMIQYFPDQYEQVVRLIEVEGIRDTEAERRVFGEDHNTAGALIARMWKLPPHLHDAVIGHSDLSRASENIDLVSVVRIADILCEMWGAGVREGIREVELEREHAWQVLCTVRPELAGLDVELFTFELEHEFEKADEYIQTMTS